MLGSKITVILFHIMFCIQLRCVSISSEKDLQNHFWEKKVTFDLCCMAKCYSLQLLFHFVGSFHKGHFSIHNTQGRTSPLSSLFAQIQHSILLFPPSFLSWYYLKMNIPKRALLDWWQKGKVDGLVWDSGVPGSCGSGQTRHCLCKIHCWSHPRAQIRPKVSPFQLRDPTTVAVKIRLCLNCTEQERSG